MIQTAIMVEGQNGLNWLRWQHLAQTVEELGFAGLYRSDHFTNANPPDLDSLELWVSLTWLASHTRRIEFGPLVSPISFRHPTMTARMAGAVDDLSNGRLTLGLGAGWQEREHHNYGWELLDLGPRFERFEEGLQVITRLLHSEQAVNFAGKYYQLHEAILLPRPARQGGPPILIGGNGKKRTLPLAARYAQEWNAVFISPREFQRLNALLDQLLAELDRPTASVKRSLMTGLFYGSNEAEVEQVVADRTHGKRTAEELRQKGLVVGTPEQVKEQVDLYAQAGVQRIMLQWIDLDNLDGLEALAKVLL
ncbi:MAG: LLM class F420-dependent oxidoreductase [Anaerolineales bacterium]|nr:LLM class F420-dependent oxidoreductase [Anaerolineales bacterium]